MPRKCLQRPPSGAESIHSVTAPLSDLLNSTQLLLQPTPPPPLILLTSLFSSLPSPPSLLPPPLSVADSEAVAAPGAFLASASVGEVEEAKKGRKALLPSKRQGPPPLSSCQVPPPFPSSSPSISTVRVTPGSKQFLTPMSSARLLAFKSLEDGEGGKADGIIRRLEYDEKTQPTPGRAEANQRQKQGLPLLVYCRIRPLSKEEQRQRTTTTTPLS